MVGRLVLLCAALTLLGSQVSPQKVTTTSKATSGTPGRQATFNPQTNKPRNIQTPKPPGTNKPTKTTKSIKTPKTTKPTTTTKPTKTPKTTKPTTKAKPTTNPKTTTPTGKQSTTKQPPTSGLPTVYSQPPGDIKLKKDNLLKNLTKLGKEWEISFEFNPKNYDNKNYTNILHLTIGEDYTKVGDRIPAIFYHPGRGLHVTCGIGNDKNYHKDIMPELPLNKWSTILVSQVKTGSVTNFNIEVAGAAPFSVENPTPQEFSAVKVFASDPWWDTQPGSIKSLTIKTK